MSDPAIREELAFKLTGTVIPGILLAAMLAAFAVGGFYLGSARQTVRDNDGMPLRAERLRVRPLDRPVLAKPTLLGERAVSDIVRRTMPFVVSVQAVTKVPPTHGGQCRGQQYFFGPGMGPHMSASPYERFDSGSGVIYRSDGYIITSNHVVRHADKIKVSLSDRRLFDAQVVGRDQYADLALLKVNTSGLPAARLGDSDALSPGDWAIAIGSPMRLENTVSLGIISAVGRTIGDPASRVDLIQTDAAINPGNSGGPLINIDGQVIGINTAVRSDAQNIGFAIPVRTVKRVADELLSRGVVKRAFIGIFMQDVDDTLFSESLSTSFPDGEGVLITGVNDKSPAQAAGLAAGDVLKSLSGRPVRKISDVRRILERHVPGERLSLTIQRSGTPLEREVVLAEHPGGLP